MSYGTRGWIGRVEPALWYEGAEWEAVLPDGVDVVVTCTGLNNLVQDELESAYDAIIAQVRRLDHARVSVINVGGTPVVTSRGLKGHDELVQRLRETTKIPTVTSMSAEFGALRTLGATRVVIAAPYPVEQTDRRKKLMSEGGFDVVHAESLDLIDVDDIARLQPEEILELAVGAARLAPSAEAIYLPCGVWPASRIIARLDELSGLPAVANVQSQAWASLRAMGVKDAVPGFGRLFQHAAMAG